MIMMIRRRDLSVTVSIVIALVIVGVVFWPTRKPHVSIPPLTDVGSIQVVFHSSSPDPKPIPADSSQGKADIAQLL